MKPMSKAEQLDRELAGLCLSEERKTAILEAMKGEGPVSQTKRILHTAAIAAALCVLLTISALALSPTLQEILSQALGKFEPYSQSVEGVSVTDQGIQVSVVRSIGDENGGSIYLEIKDLTGDRLTGDARLGSITYPIAYDPEDRTLLTQTKWRGGGSILDEEGNITITIREIWGGEEFSLPLPAQLLEPDNVLQTTLASAEQYSSISDDRIVLVPEQTPMDLGVEWFTLSSMGFDEKGRLHVQIKMAEGYSADQLEWCFPDLVAIAGFLNEKEAAGEIDRTTVHGKTHLLEDERYVDYCVMPEEDIFLHKYMPKEWYRDIELNLDGWIGTRERIEGNWTLTFPMESLPERTVTVEQVVDTKLIETAAFSVRGVTLRTVDTTGRPGSLSPLTAAVYLADGSHITMKRGVDAHWYKEEEPYFLTTWEFPEPIDPSEVTAISLGYYYIPLDGETAQPGHWLAELPE